MQRFLELAVPVQDVQASLLFWRGLGFESIPVGEIWPHRYAVVSDGRAVVGLHDARFDEPTPCFVRTRLNRFVDELQRSGLAPERAQLAPDRFNELALRDPDGGAVQLFEAPTHTPAEAVAGGSLCGHFLEYSLPCRDLAAAAAFWDALGLLEGWRGGAPHPWVRYTGSGISLGLHATGTLRPGLTFVFDEPDEHLPALVAAGFTPDRPGRIAPLPGCVATLDTPEGTRLYLCREAEWERAGRET